MSTKEKLADGVRLTRYSMTANAVLIVFKCAAGFAANSQALIADGVHSIVDMGSDIATMFGLRLAAMPRDGNHPYGHHRFVTLITLGIGLSIGGFCVGLASSSLARLNGAPVVVEAGWIPLAVALGALVVKETFYRFASAQARRLKSRLLMANAMDHRTDSVASLMALIALIAVRWGGPKWAVADAAVGLLMAGWMGAEAIRMIWHSLKDLMDTSPAEDVLHDIAEHILPVDGVRGYHAFRARRIGDMYEVDMHLQVSGDISVEAGHAIAGRVRAVILERHPEVFDALIHVEPDSPEHLVVDKGISAVKV